MEKRKRLSTKTHPDDTAEIYEDYESEYRPEKGQSVLGYLGIIFAILIGSTIIGLSVIFSSGKVPGFGLFNVNLPAAQQNSVNTTGSNANSPANTNTVVEIPLSPNYPMLGSADAPVTMVEFADFQCPYCKDFQDNAFAKIKSDYIDKGIVKFYFLNFPFLGDESTSAAISAECARQQNKFWPYHDLLYHTQGLENSGVFSDAELKKLATQAGLNLTKYNSCIKSPDTAQAVAQQFKLGQDSGVRATPTIYINGKKDEGSNLYSEYKALIDQAAKGN